MEQRIPVQLINETYEQLRDIKSDFDFFKSSEIMRFSIISIEMALGLFQLGIIDNRPINEFEENWFKGGFFIHHNLDGGWSKLADNYSKISDIVESRNYFRG